METIYTAEALATGGGRDGHVRTTDGIVDTDLALPRAMGGAENAPNPELLFAAGYAACFHGALQLVAGNEGASIDGSSVGSRVSLGKDDEGFALAVEIEVHIPDMDLDSAQKLADTAHTVCPYSRATSGNIEVTVTAVED
ncbi:organic hydroperoxide resistance protein [Corynebacterium sp. CCM 8835]|uniref:Organic hydroperoxide resistance protein n=1 Tax=Corynebacterium antarcticum TaxID=2800405 RepID=A0ABS1FNW6_9CORY|nr:organic hydroperoxide resistance protein [Corynebacterium antarcticum]MCK7641856.1 organic hydroperoxide resistance protein [Corynebacterium antarcticum]MCK7660039.1 organic hydroperoxide resistance protein [Corynebacterium antarcticum]MCL0245084.1 organic hydroperoxide resistance protein [Corynebacterium antarcticum]MCX7539363.1 organic hydroperoxide resistance protein [Corynebacterium antarcticum]